MRGITQARPSPAGPQPFISPSQPSPQPAPAGEPPRFDLCCCPFPCCWRPPLRCAWHAAALAWGAGRAAGPFDIVLLRRCRPLPARPVPRFIPCFCRREARAPATYLCAAHFAPQSASFHMMSLFQECPACKPTRSPQLPPLLLHAWTADAHQGHPQPPAAACQPAPAIRAGKDGRAGSPVCELECAGCLLRCYAAQVLTAGLSGRSCQRDANNK